MIATILFYQVDELLDWTTSLNFEDYVSSWKQMGTSSLSETAAEKRHYLNSNNRAKMNFDTNTGPRAGSNSVVNSRPGSAKARVMAT